MKVVSVSCHDVDVSQAYPPMSVRLILWMLVMAWAGFSIAGKGSYLPLGVTVSGAIIGAGIGLLIGVMFSRRKKRRHEPKAA